MACPDVFQALKLASESLGKTVQRKATARSVWLNAIPKGAYPLGTGLTQTSFQIANSMPRNDELAWEKIASTGSAANTVELLEDGGLCARDWQDVEWGYSEQQYSPERISIRGPNVCQSNLKYHHSTDAFLRAYVEEITKHSKRMLENKLQNEYMKKSRQVTFTGAAGSGAIDDSAVGTDDVSAATLNASAALLQEHLDLLAVKLIESGATEGDSNGWIELGPNGPVFPLIIGMEASNALLKADSNLRTDYNYGAPTELLKAMGADRVIGNFRHIVITNPPRWTHSTTTYTRVSEYEASSETAGVGVQRAAAYNAATHESAIVLNPSVMKQLVVPSTTPGNLGFTPENYTGDWKFITGAYKWGGTNADCDDPLEVNGRHVGTYEMAFEPVFGEHGATVQFVR